MRRICACRDCRARDGIALQPSQDGPEPLQDEAPPTAVELDAVLASIDGLERLLRIGDADAETASDQLARMLEPTQARDRAAAVAASASRYDFDGAQAALARLRADLSHGK